MSAATDLSTKVVQICMPLLNEGTDVFRPVFAELTAENVYKVLPAPSYDSSIEHWEFPPGSIVGCVTERRSGQEVLVARKQLASKIAAP